MMKRFQTRMRGSMGGRGGDDLKLGGPRGFALLGGALVLLWAASGVYVVDAGQRGVVTQFGVWVGTSEPGLHVHLPWPIESVRVEPFTAVRQTLVGPVDTDQGGDDSRENLMITRDQALVNLGFTVQWVLKDVEDYVFNVRNPVGQEDELVAAAAESAMREIVGQRDLDDVIATDQAGVAESTRELTQRILDSYRAGIEIRQINLRARAPARVSEAFADVLAATQDRETKINEANAYANQVVPKARGEAQQMLQQAEAYKEQVVREAAGEAERFNLLYAQYRTSPRVTRDRLYLETMERVIGKADKIIVDQGSGVNPYLPLDSIRRGAQAGGPSGGPAASAQGGAPR